MGPNKFRSEDVPIGTRTITPVGELDSAATAKLRRLLAGALDDHVRRVIVDLSEIDYIDTSAIAMLMDASSRATRQHARVLVVSPPGSRASTIFRLTQADQIMPVVETRAQALHAA